MKSAIKKVIRNVKKVSGYYTLQEMWSNRKLRDRLKHTTDWKMVVGASGVFEKGWIPTEMHQFDLLNPDSWKVYVPNASISVILAEHVWEHLSYDNGLIAAVTCYQYLKPGGYLRIAVPDGFHPDPGYVNQVKPGGTGWGADDHKMLYNYTILSKLLSEAGFKVKLLEYFDEKGDFHFNDWDRNDGMIHRSKRYDERNEGGKLNYTSIIIDAVK
ncbi:class I SAM-dependent methyltransferase [Chitinophaga nivalis]|uniref:SAM-dependent methyltransferase n=1 Tax=Chitinophaga nivalis TaxID=2991709 RepID=A0ABT3IRR6_9BACT|nr:hypothetical protein [Chitinophaga nivalis]MCW3463639.1 hypothetical protein [Chitinophaga nivalis]MCW3486671.1 hypothetical protein [Chitinophaga nivalis]